MGGSAVADELLDFARGLAGHQEKQEAQRAEFMAVFKELSIPDQLLALRIVVELLQEKGWNRPTD